MKIFVYPARRLLRRFAFFPSGTHPVFRFRRSIAFRTDRLSSPQTRNRVPMNGIRSVTSYLKARFQGTL